MLQPPDDLGSYSDEGGYYRGRYFGAEDLQAIHQVESVRRMVESNRADMIDKGLDPDAVIRDIDTKLEAFIAQCDAYDEAEGELMIAHAEAAEARRRLSLRLCLDYLALRDGLYETLAALPDERRAAHLEHFASLKDMVQCLYHELPAEDGAELRRRGWRDSDWA